MISFSAFMAWLENSYLGLAMRETGVWTYAAVNLFHILGVSTLFGSIIILDLRLLGFWRRIPLAALSSVTVPLAATGFIIAAVTGSGLLATKATEYVGNPFLTIKFIAIPLGLINIALIHYSAAWKAHRTRALTGHEESHLAAMGAVSLLSWFTAVGAGRMIGYW